MIFWKWDEKVHRFHTIKWYTEPNPLLSFILIGKVCLCIVRAAMNIVSRPIVVPIQNVWREIERDREGGRKREKSLLTVLTTHPLLFTVKPTTLHLSFSLPTTFQERYKDRMSVVEKMRAETQYLITLVKQLTPFIHNYKAVSAKIHPNLGGSSGSFNQTRNGQSVDSMSQIIQTIKEINPDSGQRIAAIEQAEREKSENKRNKNSQLEEDLVKQKGKLRSVVNSSEDISLLLRSRWLGFFPDSVGGLMLRHFEL
eukprot:sb/3468596/